MKKEPTTGFDKFEMVFNELIRVPHSEIKAKLSEEKKAKELKKNAAAKKKSAV